MSARPVTRVGKLKLAAVPLLLAGLAACDAPFNADVSRYAVRMPAPAGQTFTVVPEDPRMAGGLEFAQYAHSVADHMAALGYTPVNDPAHANLIVRFDYGVDRGRERIRSTGFNEPMFGPWYGYRGFGFGGYYGRHFGPWGYGWYDPFFDSPGVESYTVYTSGIDLEIDRASDGARLFEGKAQAVSTSNRLQYLVPNLVEAMFTGFPGNNGETVRISVAPEQNRRR